MFEVVGEVIHQASVEVVAAEVGIAGGGTDLDHAVADDRENRLIGVTVPHPCPGTRRMLDEVWHLVVCISDLLLQTARRPVVAHGSAARPDRTQGGVVAGRWLTALCAIIDRNAARVVTPIPLAQRRE